MLKLLILIVGLAVGFGGGVYWGVHHPEQASQISQEEERRFLELQIKTTEAVKILRDLGTPCLIHQPKYSMFVRGPEDGLFAVLKEEGIGCIPFSPLAQGLLTNRYLQGIPKDSRAAKSPAA